MSPNTIPCSQNLHLETSGVISIKGYFNSKSLSKLLSHLFEGIPRPEILHVDEPGTSKTYKKRKITIYTSNRETALLIFSKVQPWFSGQPMTRSLRLRIIFPDQNERLISLKHMNKPLLQNQPPLSFDKGHKKALCSLKHTTTPEQQYSQNHGDDFLPWLNTIYRSCLVEVPYYEEDELFDMIGDSKRIRGLISWKILDGRKTLRDKNGDKQLRILINFKIPSQTTWFCKLINNDKSKLINSSAYESKADVSLLRFLEMAYNYKVEETFSTHFEKRSQFIYTQKLSYQHYDVDVSRTRKKSRLDGIHCHKKNHVNYSIQKLEKMSFMMAYMFKKKFSEVRRKQLYKNIEGSQYFRETNRSKVTD